MASNDKEPDVLIIGAGASGAAVAWSLSQAGFSVMCLEQGDWVKPSEFHMADREWEISRQTDMNPDPNGRGLPQDYPVNNEESAIAPLMYNAVGGGTIHMGALFPRMHPSDFRVRSLDGVAVDWPVTYAELEPYFDLNDRMMGVSGLDGDPFYPPKSHRPMPPLDPGVAGETIAKGFDKLGWRWWPADSAIATTPYGEDRRPCNYGGSCEQGCMTGAKATADTVYMRPAMRSGAVLKTRARVRELVTGNDGRVRSVVYDDAVHEQSARLFVLACNGVGTPRLLLNSCSHRFPDGLANSSGVVGKNLMFHPTALVTGVFDERVDNYKGPVACSIYSHEFYETDESRGFVRGYQLGIIRDFGPLWLALGGTLGERVPWGSKHHRDFVERYGHLINITVLTEDLPEESNQVVLDPQLTDGSGIPAPKVTYHVGDNTNRMLEHGIVRGTEVLEAASARRVTVWRVPRAAGWHLLGTARTGSDPSSSVVDGWGRCHDVSNLFIVDGSVFATAGAVNPTSTIQAFALRTADYIKQNRRHLRE